MQKPLEQPNLLSFSQIKLTLMQTLRQPELLSRYGIHALIVALIFATLTLGNITLPAKELQAEVPVEEANPSTTNIQAANITADTAPPVLPKTLQNRNRGVLLSAPVPYTIIPDRTDHSPKIQQYTVQPGDTIIGIALKFGLQPETLQWSNPKLEDNPDLLMVGDELTILPVDGVYHQVAANETLDEIAGTLKVSADDIINYPLNNLDPENPTIAAGQWLIVPGGEKPYVPKHVSAVQVNVPDSAQRGTGNFQWPTNGTITQEYWSGHRALDIGGWIGNPIYAADAGYVIYAGWDNSGYGNLVEINHGNGFITLYAHMDKIYVSVGDEVGKGQQIGEMGSTGRSTGPHLHFEVRLNGVQRNPWGFLP